jgi:drug/metabolite transporter (DMT)-like permease
LIDTMDETTSRRSAVIALFVLCLIWGFNWTVMKSVLHYVGPMTFSAYRYVLATIILFVVLIVRREPLAPTPWLPTLVIGLAQTAGFQALVQLSLMSGGAGRMALIAYTMPFWVIPLAWILLGEKPTPRQWSFTALAACGLLLIFEPWRVQPSLLSALLALAGGFCWALGTVLSKKQFQTTDVSLLRLTTWQMAMGSAVLLFVALVVPERATEFNAPFLGALAYNALLSTSLAWVLWLFVVKRLPANVAGLGSLISPLVGVLFAWMLLGEVPDAAEACGIATIAIALLGVLRPSVRPSPAPPVR